MLSTSQLVPDSLSVRAWGTNTDFQGTSPFLIVHEAHTPSISSLTHSKLHYLRLSQVDTLKWALGSLSQMTHKKNQIAKPQVSISSTEATDAGLSSFPFFTHWLVINQECLEVYLSPYYDKNVSLPRLKSPFQKGLTDF